ncbi:MAG: hypothetical protein AAF726_03535 [Planctomycetota bacterium]
MKRQAEAQDVERDAPEVVEVEVERLEERPTRGQQVRRRVVGTLVPVVLAMVIDAGDLTLGLIPIARPLALPLGLIAGFVFSGYLRIAPTWRVIVTCLVGIYLVMPFTSMIPLATVIAAVSQVMEPRRWQDEPFA